MSAKLSSVTSRIPQHQLLSSPSIRQRFGLKGKKCVPNLDSLERVSGRDSTAGGDAASYESSVLLNRLRQLLPTETFTNGDYGRQ